MWVKICGITRPEDAVAAVQLGADAIGFVLTPSPRRADPEALKAWIHSIHWVEKVGVFTQEDPRLILSLGQALGLNSIQVHGELTPEHTLLFEHFEIIYAVRDSDMMKKNVHRSLSEVGTICRPPLKSKKGNLPCRIMIDGSMGTGTAGTWVPRDCPYILAGGLNPRNVREAILKAHPAGVDVSSGVEASPGIKDVALMERFIKEART